MRAEPGSESGHSGLKVLFLSPEAVPFAKSGGLADVACALPNALKRLGADVRIVLPFYRAVRQGNFSTRVLIKALDTPTGNIRLRADILETLTTGGVPVYLVDREDLYDRPNLYGNAYGDYYDNLERFTFFSHAALRTAQAIGFRPDVVHCHDWQTGLVPALLKGPYRTVSTLAGTPTVFTIHNIGYQGIFPSEKLPVTGLSPEFFHPEGMEYWGKISLLKAGLVYSEAITTVSPRYSLEIQTPEYGMGMEGLLLRRRDVLSGILNGADYSLWDPEKDIYIAHHYRPGCMEGKTGCKEALIREMGLDPALNRRPLLGMISRLDVQKGLDLVLQILDDLMEMNTGLVILGAGDEAIQAALQQAAERHPGRIGLFIGLNEALAHRIMAGTDILLVPSRYEPCGLTQLYALRYGTVPVVRAVGGLDDTVLSFDPATGKGTGFKFESYDAGEFLSAIKKAVGIFTEPAMWGIMVANGLRADFSWDRSARKYYEVYRTLIAAGAGRRYN